MSEPTSSRCSTSTRRARRHESLWKTRSSRQSEVESRMQAMRSGTTTSPDFLCGKTSARSVTWPSFAARYQRPTGELGGLQPVDDPSAPFRSSAIARPTEWCLVGKQERTNCGHPSTSRRTQDSWIDFRQTPRGLMDGATEADPWLCPATRQVPLGRLSRSCRVDRCLRDRRRSRAGPSTPRDVLTP